jgi:hypothetical protein
LLGFNVPLPTGVSLTVQPALGVSDGGGATVGLSGTFWEPGANESVFDLTGLGASFEVSYSGPVGGSVDLQWNGRKGMPNGIQVGLLGGIEASPVTLAHVGGAVNFAITVAGSDKDRGLRLWSFRG